MTRDEAKAKAEETVYVNMTEGVIMNACDANGFQYQTKRDGHFSKGERSRCEQYLIELFTNRNLSGNTEGAE